MKTEKGFVLLLICFVGSALSIETKQVTKRVLFRFTSFLWLDKVTCGSLIKLKHVVTKFRLHSHEIPYGQGSRQQSVTAFPKPDDANSYWIVRGTKVIPTYCKSHSSCLGTTVSARLAYRKKTENSIATQSNSQMAPQSLSHFPSFQKPRSRFCNNPVDEDRRLGQRFWKRCRV